MVYNVRDRDPRTRLRCEHCVHRHRACTFQRRSLPPSVHRLSTWEPQFITKRWCLKNRFIPTTSVRTPRGQDVNLLLRSESRKGNYLSKEIAYNGGSLQQFTIERVFIFWSSFIANCVWL
jgi:hypothetical protein